MIFFSDPQETASRFGDYIEDLHDVFRCNDVDFGSPEDFSAFARTVKYRSELRCDVMRVVKSVMEHETDVSFRIILTIIAVASGGVEVATSDREMSTPVHQVIESLIGVGASSRKVDLDPSESVRSELTAKETAKILALDISSTGNSEAAGGADAMEETDGAGHTETMLHTEATHTEPMHTEPMHTEPMHTEPMHTEPMHTEPMHVETVHTEATHTEATHTEVDAPFLQQDASDSSVDQSLPGPESLPDGSNDVSNDYALANTLAESTVAESLTRLELNSLQLKIYLDSIDQRISRMEPRLENVPSLVLSSPSPHSREQAGARFSATIPSKSEPAPSHNDSSLPKQKETPAPGGTGATAASAGTATGPLPVFARVLTGSRKFHFSRRQRTLPILAAVAILLLAISLFWRFGRETVYAVVHSVNASVAAGDKSARLSPAPAVASTVNDPPRTDGPISEAPITKSSINDSRANDPPITDSGKGTQGISSAPAYGSTTQGVSRRADHTASSAKKPAQIPFKSSKSSSLLSSSASADADNAAGSGSDGSEVASAPDDDDVSSEPVSNHLVNVSSGVMAANFVSGPKPSYPVLASLTRTQGNVVMQAVISKDGTVEHLKVIKGHRLLRSAAKNAVRNWRYRPYKVRGMPVEVATIVSVDFSLHH